MVIFISTILFIAITVIIWLLNKVLPFEVCPICAGISGSWLLLSAGIVFGLLEAGSWQLAVALAMGGSVVGIAYKSEHIFSWGRENPLLWKLIVIGTGTPLAYLTVSFLSFRVFIAEVIFLSVLTYIFFVRKQEHKLTIVASNNKIKELEDKLKNCC